MGMVLGMVAMVPFVTALNEQAKLDMKSPTWQFAKTKVVAQRGSDWFQRITAGNVSVRAIRQGPPYWAELALTFDDGPHGEVTEELLRLLDHYKVKATFFVVGKMVRNRKVLTKRIFDAGHEIGNHSYSHPDLSKLGVEDILTEYKATNLMIEKVTGVQPRYCRPPGGQMNQKTLQAASALGMSTVYWNNNPGDYKFDSPEAVLERLRAKRLPGAIVLLHSGLKPTVQALRTFIPESLKMGYRFVLVGDWDAPRKSATLSGAESV